MEKHDHTFHYAEPFWLESGEILPGFQLRYTTLGKLNSDRNNVIWICHALTGSSDFTTWWADLFTDNRTFDLQQHLIICANMLGGCYGSTGPLSIHPETGKRFFHSFPLLTNRDAVRAFDLLRQHLEIEKIHTVIGASLGGQQALEWAVQQPDAIQNLVAIACNATHSPWGIAFNEAQRLAIEADPTWKQDDDRAGLDGLKAARAIALLSYRHYEGFELAQGENTDQKLDQYKAASYQRYQGEKLSRRFNAFTYWTLSKMMDNHNVGRGWPSIEHALNQIRSKTLLIGIDSDLLFPVTEQMFLQKHIPSAELSILSSAYGHDGFLVEYKQLKNSIAKFYNRSLSSISV